MACVDCGNETIGKSKRCQSCKVKRKKEQYAFHNSKRPAACRRSKEYCDYCNFVETLTNDEISALVSSKITKLKYAKTYDERQDLKTQIKILEFYYTKNKENTIPEVETVTEADKYIDEDDDEEVKEKKPLSRKEVYDGWEYYKNNS